MHAMAIRIGICVVYGMVPRIACVRVWLLPIVTCGMFSIKLKIIVSTALGVSKDFTGFLNLNCSISLVFIYKSSLY